MKKWKCVIGIFLFVVLIAICQQIGKYMLDSIRTGADTKRRDTKYRRVVIDVGHGRYCMCK